MSLYVSLLLSLMSLKQITVCTWLNTCTRDMILYNLALCFDGTVNVNEDA